MEGIIGFFDILGYKNFLKNNSATETAEAILEIVANAGEETKKLISPVMKGYEGFAELVQSRSKWLVFSDTLVYTYSLDGDLALSAFNAFSKNKSLEIDCSNFNDLTEDQNQSLVNEVVRLGIYDAILSARLLNFRMFSMGLPLRGALHFGEYLYKDVCLAGLGIVESHDLCENLDLSATIFSDSFAEIAMAVYEEAGTDYIQEGIYSYLIPFKKGQEKHMPAIDWLYDFREAPDYDVTDIPQYVHEAFWRHQKDIPLSVDGKLNNTIKLLRFFEMAFKHKDDPDWDEADTQISDDKSGNRSENP